MSASLYTTIPAYCPTCKKLFSSSAFALGAGSSVVVSSCVTNCPQGHDAHFLDGSYSLQDSVLRLATDAPETLNIIRKLAEQVIRGEIEQKVAAKKIVAIAPSLASIFNRKSPDLLPWFALLVSLIVGLANAYSGKGTASQIISPVIINKIYNLQNDTSTAPSPAETDTHSLDQNRSKRQKRRDRGRGFF